MDRLKACYRDFANLVAQKIEENDDRMARMHFSTFSLYVSLFWEEEALQVKEEGGEWLVEHQREEEKKTLRCGRNGYTLASYTKKEEGWVLRDAWTVAYDAQADRYCYEVIGDPVLELTICWDVFRAALDAEERELPLVKSCRWEYDRLWKETQRFTERERWSLEVESVSFSFVFLLGVFAWRYFQRVLGYAKEEAIYCAMLQYSHCGVLSDLNARFPELAKTIFKQGFRYAQGNAHLFRFDG